MIALIAGDEPMRAGPIPVALAYAGFMPRAIFTTDEARERLERFGLRRCFLVIDAGLLDSPAGSGTWGAFLARHPALPAVVVAHGSVPPEAGAVAGTAHRILLEHPFAPADLAAAARRASSSRRLSTRSVSRPARDTG